MKRFLKKLRIFFRLKKEELVRFFKYNSKPIIGFTCFFIVWGLTAYFLPIDILPAKLSLSFLIILVSFCILGLLYYILYWFINLIMNNWERAEIELQRKEKYEKNNKE